MLVLVRGFSCTSDDTSIEVFLSVTLLVLVLVRWVFFTHLMLVLVSCFSYAPHASLNPDDSFSKLFLLVTLLMLVLVRSFSCTPDANFSEEFLLYS